MNANELELNSWATKAGKQLHELAAGIAPKAQNKENKLDALKPVIHQLRAEGYSYDQIAPLLGKIENPIEITGSALRRKMAKKRQKKAKKDDKKEIKESPAESTG